MDLLLMIENGSSLIYLSRSGSGVQMGRGFLDERGFLEGKGGGLATELVVGSVARETDEQLLRELRSGCYDNYLCCYDNESLVAIEIYHSNYGDGLR